MFKIVNKIEFDSCENKMKSVADTKTAIEIFNSNKSKNLRYLLEQRFGWMNKFIKDDECGIEFGSGAGFAKYYIKNKNFKMSDLSEDKHLDFKKVDAQSTDFKNESKSDDKNAWAGNIAVPHLLFDDKEEFKIKMGNFFSIEYEEITECFIFLNSGGVTSKTMHIPLPFFMLKLLNFVDKILVKILPNIFGMGRRIVLRKLN